MSDDFAVDFICIGFPKCGTTTLYSVLKKHPQISLARGKETSFFNWCNSFTDPLKILEEKYFMHKRGSEKKIGLIESEFYKNAKDVKHYFGKNVRLIFMIRDPVERLYSAFRMRLRQGQGEIMRLYARNKHKTIAELFDIYCKQVIINNQKIFQKEFLIGKYMFWINEFRREFGDENILLIFLEDYRLNAEKEIEKIERFIGVKEKHLNANEKENIGKQVSKGFYSSVVNGLFNSVYAMNMAYFVSHTEQSRLFLDIRNNIYGYTLINNKEKMSGFARTLCERYYYKSKVKVGKYCERDIKEIW